MNLKKIGIFILIFVVLLGISNILFRFVLPIKAVFLVSGSMEPAYNENDVVFWKQADTYNLDDVVIFKGNLPSDIVSRIIDVNDDGTFNLKGDANPTSIYFERNVPKERIKGKIVYSISPFIFYGITYGIIIVLAFFGTNYIVKNKK